MQQFNINAQSTAFILTVAEFHAISTPKVLSLMKNLLLALAPTNWQEATYIKQ